MSIVNELQCDDSISGNLNSPCEVSLLTVRSRALSELDASVATWMCRVACLADGVTSVVVSSAKSSTLQNGFRKSW